LDSVTGRWSEKGLATVTELAPAGRPKPTAATAPVTSEPVAPVKPAKANGNAPTIAITVDPDSFKELVVYDKLRFQLEASETAFNPADTAVEWQDVRLQKTAVAGLYTVTFSNGNKTVSYRARPVFEGKDYENAMKVFEQKTEQYQKQKNARLTQEHANRQQYASDSLALVQSQKENEQLQRINALVEARNREIEKRNAIVAQRNQQIEDRLMASRFVKSFQIDGFGVWNLDRLSRDTFSTVICQWVDKKGQLLQLSNTAVLHPAINAITSYDDNHVKVQMGQNNILIGVHDGKIAYAPYKAPAAMGDAGSIKTIAMTVLTAENQDYEAIKKALKQ
jgi:hypothetical protein